MNDVQKNAIREADNYLKAAGLPTYSALTQRPAAQTEREAFEEWYAEDANKQTGKPGWFTPKSIAELRDGDGYGEHRVMLNGKWEGWQARASLPAPQQGVASNNPTPQADPRNPGWCLGCNPDNCMGCGIGLNEAQQATPESAQHKKTNHE